MPKKPLTKAGLVEEIKGMKQIYDAMEEDIKNSDDTIAMLRKKENTYLATIRELEEKENNDLQTIKILEDRLEAKDFNCIYRHTNIRR